MENNQKIKKCIICNNSKELKFYSKRKSMKHGYKNECKECLASIKKEYYRTIPGLITKIFGQQLSSSRKRNHNPPQYTKDELSIWIQKQDNFKKLYNGWVNSEYDMDLVPSIDRLNDYIGYSFNNIRLVTFKENRNKSFFDKIYGINNKNNRSVNQYSKDDIFIASFFSIHDASRKLNINYRNICSCCQEKRLFAGGYIWKYKT